MGAKYTYALGILKGYSYKNLSALLKLLSTNSKAVATSALFGVLITITTLFLSLTAEAQQSVQVLWPLTSDSEAVYSVGIGSATFKAGPALKNFQYDSINGATATGWNGRNLDPNAYYEYSITPERDATLVFNRLKFEVSLSSVNMRTALYYSKDGFNKQSIPVGNPVFVGKKSSRDLLVETNITVTYPETLTIRVYGWSAPNPAVSFYAGNVEIDGYLTDSNKKQLSESVSISKDSIPTSIEEVSDGGDRGSGSYTTAGTYTWICPPGVTSISVEAWGGGAGGNNNTDRGGGGGAYAGNTSLTVTPNNSYTITVGSGGDAGNNGGNSSFGNLVVAAGANGANGGTVANSTGTIRYAGGNGGSSTSTGGAGGGGSAGAGGNGGVGGISGNTNGGTGGLAGIAGAGSPGATGGNGGSRYNNGSIGNAPGGGGGESGENGGGSGAGADGQVNISWTIPAGNCEGFAISQTNTGVTNPAYALNAPNNQGAGLNETNDVLTLDLINSGYLLSSGGSVIVRWRRVSGSNSIIRVDLSDGTSWTTVADYTNIPQNTWTNQNIPLTINTRYVRFTSVNGWDLDIDAVSYNTPCAPPCTNPSVFNVTGGGSYCSGGSGLPVGLSDSEIGVKYQLYLGAAQVGAPIDGTGNAISFGNQTATGTYTVVATRTSGGCTSNMSGSAVITIITTPLPPTSTAGTNAQCTQITANWSASANATGYYLDVSTVNTFASYVPGYNNLNVNNVTTYNVTGLTSGTTYYYRIRAYNTCGTSVNSNVITYATSPSAPSAPTANTGTNAQCSQITANWSAAVNASGYYLDVSTVNTFATFVAGYNNLNVNNVTTYNVTGLTPGTTYYYRVRAYNSCGTSGSSNVITYATSPSAPLSPTADAGTNSQCTQFTANWSASVNATGYYLDVSTVNTFATFIPGYNNLNVNNVTTYIVTGLTAGTTYYYRVRAYNSCGASGNSSVITYSTLPGPATPGAISGTVLQCPNLTGQVYSVLPVANATSYTWTVPTGWSITSPLNTNSITVTTGAAGQNGNITVSASNSCGTSATATLAVTVQSLPSQTSPISPATTAVCQNTVHTFLVNPVPPVGVTYTWTGPPGSTITSGQGLNMINILVGNQSGTLTITPSNSCGNGPSQSLNITVSAGTPAMPGPITGEISPCVGSSKTYSVPDLGLLYTWSVPSGWSIVSGQGTASINVTVGATAGNISVTAGNPCGASQARTLLVTPQPGVPLQPSEIQGTNPVCSGSVQTYSVTNVPFVTYTWTVTGAGWSINSGNGSNSVTVTVGNVNGTLTVTPSNDCGVGTPRSKSITVDIAPPANAGTINGLDNPCQASIQTYFVSNVPGVSYAWTVPGDWTINSGQGTNSIQVTVGTSTGNIVVVPSNGCGNGPSSTKPVTVYLLPFSPGTITGPTEICEGSTVNYSVLNTPGITYNWTFPADWTYISGQGTNVITITIGKLSGTLVVIPNNACGNGPASSLDIKVNPLPLAFTIEDGDICVGASIFIGGPAVPGNSYSWTSIPSGFTSTLSNPEVQPTETTTYYLVETNNTTGCTNSNNVTIQANQIIALTVNPLSQTICTRQNATIIVTSNIIGTTFSWSATLTSGSSTTFNPGGTGGLINENIINNSNAPSQVTYQISAKADKCENNDASAIVTINPAPNNNNQGPVQLCSDAASGIILGASTNGLPIGGYNIKSINANGLTASAGAPVTGTGFNANVIADDAWTNTTVNPVNVIYTVEGVSNAGCIGNTFTVTLTINPEPIITNNPDKAICSGTSTGIALTSSIPSTFTWTIGTITGGITGASNGTGNSILQTLTNPSNSNAGTVQYIITPRAITGTCFGDPFIITVTVYPGPVITIPSSKRICSGSNTNITLLASTPCTFTWSIGTNIGGITGATAGSGNTINQSLLNPSNAVSGSIQYIVTATAISGGCTSSAFTITVTVDPIPVVNATANPMSVCPDEQFDLGSTSSLIWVPTAIFTEDFNAPLNNWTITPAAGQGRWSWIFDGVPYDNIVFHSNDNTPFYRATSRQSGAVNTSLQSPPIIIPVGYISLSLSFYHHYRHAGSSSAKVQVSTDGVNWADVRTYTTSTNGTYIFEEQIVDLNAYVGNPTLYLKFVYQGNNNRYWNIDNISIKGTTTNAIPTISWTSSLPPYFYSSIANPQDVSQIATNTYTVTYTNTLSSCSASDDIEVITKPLPNAQITADYCSHNGCIELTASGGGTYLWNIVPPSTNPVICVDEAGIYNVTVTGVNGCVASAFLSAATELVNDGSFTNFNPASPGFFTEYQQNQGYWDDIPPYDWNTAKGLHPENRYAVNTNAYYEYPAIQNGYHPNFHGRDHTNNTTGQRNFMMINGSTDLIGNPPRQRTIWQQTIPINENTDYYFSAWAMNLNPDSPARLQFEIITAQNGTEQVGSIADLNVAEKPISESQVGLSNWVRFYSTPFWTSPPGATSATIRIINLNLEPGGNDFGLDDISFGTLDPVPYTIAPSVEGGTNTVCETTDLHLLSNITGGLPPYTVNWAGPNGFTSTEIDPTITNVTLAAAGTYRVIVRDSYGCSPDTAYLEIFVISSPTATISAGGNYCQFAAQPLIYLTAVGGTAPFTFTYNINGGPTQTATTWGTDNYTIVFAPTNVTGTFIYTITSVTDANGCSRNTNVSNQIVINPLPSAYITGDWIVCPNTLNQYQGNNGLSQYKWTVSGNGSIPGASNNQLVGVQSGIQCNVPFTLNLVVTDNNSCNATAEQVVMVEDVEKPVINCSVTGTQSVQINSGNVYIHAGTSWDATATDNCHVASISATLSGATSGTHTSLAGVQFNQGTTTVTWTATDDCGNNITCSFIVEVLGTADIQVIKTGPATITAGQIISYTITISNNGPATAPQVTVTDALPAIITVPITWSLNGTLQAGAWPGSYIFNNMAVGAPGQQVITITGKVNCNATTFTNTASVALGTLIDPNLANNTSTVITAIANPINITVHNTSTECDNQGSIDITVAGGTPPYTYFWTTTDGFIPPGQETQQDLTGINTGTYHVVVTDANGCQIEEEWSMVSEDVKPPTFIVPTEPTFCVVDIFSALYNGLPEPNADIEPEPVYQPQFPAGWTRPDWYIIDGSTELDLTGINDICCLPQDCTIDWTITFSNGFPPITGTGQPSTYGPIKLWGSPNYTEVIHKITYIVTDCSDNSSLPVEVNILIKPRPNVIKQ